MNNRMAHSSLSLRPILRGLALLSSILIVAACVNSRPAPVETRDLRRTTPPVVQGAAMPVTNTNTVPRPGYYIVKKGDTLYSIAMESGHDYREVAAWNGIDNAAVISVGQELRVQPPESNVPAASGTRPVILPRIESRPIEQSAPAALPPASSAPVAGAASAPAANPGVIPGNAAGIVTEPHGGRIPYSEKALKDLQAPPSAQSQPLASAPVAGAEVKPVPKPATSASAPSAATSSSAPGGEDVGEWSWPSGGKLIGTFNDASNKGIDIGGAIGDPVLAAASGKVIYAGSDLRAYGNLVIIKHGSQFTTVYAHNKEILVKEGQTVQKGQKIAVLGDSDSDRPKLHFEIRKQGKPADPLKFLPAR